MSDIAKEELWQVRMRELSGAIIVASLFQVFIGCTGLTGQFAVKVITPLTIVPCVGLVGLTLFEHAAETASTHWGIAVGCVRVSKAFNWNLFSFPPFLAQQCFWRFSLK
jgi:solute carrier family 23 (nucleobase transporter), member 1